MHCLGIDISPHTKCVVPSVENTHFFPCRYLFILFYFPLPSVPIRIVSGCYRTRPGAKSTIGIPPSVHVVVEEARRSITGEALERRQHIVRSICDPIPHFIIQAVRLKGGVPSHRAARESSVERTRQHLLDKTLPAE